MRTVNKKILIIIIAFLSVFCAINGIIGVRKVFAAQEIAIKDKDEIDEKYLPENRKWQAIATVECTGKRIWAAWMAGGVTEPDPDNHIVVAYSDDNGETFTDPYMIIDDGGLSTRMRDPVLWNDGEGKLWLFYGYSGGTFAITFENADGDINGVTVSQPKSVFSETILNKPIKTSWGEWLVNVDPYIEAKNYREGHILVSEDKGNSWYLKGIVKSNAENKRWHEASTVEKSDGSLWTVSRIERGSGFGIEESYSYDKGKTWTDYKASLNVPFRGPGSKCALYKTKSGDILFINNDSTSVRVNMTAYISSDDGKTWKYLLLDDRLGCAYPDVCENESGEFFVIWDFGRMSENEIRLSRFTKKDLLAGAFYTETAKNRIAVAKSAGYHDIIELKTGFPKSLVCKVGDNFTKESIIASLPSPIVAVIDDGREITIDGEWKINWFTTQTPGVYTFRYSYNSRLIPSGVSDNLGLLTFKAVVEDETKPATGGGCNSAIGTDNVALTTAIPIIAAIMLTVLLKKIVLFYKKGKYGRNS